MADSGEGARKRRLTEDDPVSGSNGNFSKRSKRGNSNPGGSGGHPNSSSNPNKKKSLDTAETKVDSEGTKPRGERNPDEYVRVIPVSRKPQPKPEVKQQGWHPVQLSKTDKASQMEVSEERMSVTSRKGYRMVRATHGCHEGCWHFEAKMEHLGETGHCRLGWATQRGEVQAPVGFDKYGFSYRDIGGTKQHRALREEYGESFAEGDVIGCTIILPEGGRPLEKKPKEIVRWRGILHYVDEPDPEPNTLPGSRVVFSKNGVSQGIAYKDFFEGTYYPSASLYTHPDQKEGATIAFNFGPDFKYPPAEVEGWPKAEPLSSIAGSPPEETPEQQEKVQEKNPGGAEHPPPLEPPAAATTAAPRQEQPGEEK
ncbi:hypothetical protein BSKO_04494 [Bryopsis sp. KO-2023]|nr:hypothetical protein BSKO_04494 [Bryopsis sp. KO-2023]